MENTFSNSSRDVKIIVGYDPTIHMKLLGLEEGESMEILNNPATSNFHNSVIVVHIKRRVVVVCLVTDETDDASIEEELSKLDTTLKGIYFANFQIKNEFIAMLGILICPNINTRSDLKNFQFINTSDTVNFGYLFITKTEWSGAETLINNVVSKISNDIKNDCPGNLFIFFF